MPFLHFDLFVSRFCFFLNDCQTNLSNLASRVIEFSKRPRVSLSETSSCISSPYHRNRIIINRVRVIATLVREMFLSETALMTRCNPLMLARLALPFAFFSVSPSQFGNKTQMPVDSYY